MSFTEIASSPPEVIKSGRIDSFDIDKRAEFMSTGDIFSEGKVDIGKGDFDIDKRADFMVKNTLSENNVDSGKNTEDTDENDKEKIETSDSVTEQIEKSIGTAEGLEELIENHPEKKELWDSLRDALDTLNDPEASTLEIKSAQGKISSIKGQIMEIATKDALTKAGFDVESTQRTVKGENGDTKPDVIAHNNTDKPIKAFGAVIQPGESLSVECKCARSEYLKEQLNNHIPNQLSGHEGTSVLLTTSDLKDTTPGLAEQVCDKYGTKLVISNISVGQVENTIKEVFGK